MEFAKAKEPPKEDPEEGEEGGVDDPAPEEESTATFTPVVSLQKVEVRTHEEDEDILHQQRVKLYTYTERMLDKGTGIKTWVEKGVGDIKILKHRESNRIRVLMRQDKTMKILINHFLDHRIGINLHPGSDKAWVWICLDFATGELIETTFSAKFNNKGVANEFKEAFVSGQAEMKALVEGLDSKQGAAEADEAAAALSSLSVKSEGGSAESAEEPTPTSASNNDDI